jgi:hypothetical protein
MDPVAHLVDVVGLREASIKYIIDHHHSSVTIVLTKAH